jgi:rfaE bifunctional protein nucleotidyltransferase chain/domain/rfaE bifunctional protein kinase chain/domain
VVVVGDALLDREVLGTAQRLCPDAPVPVLDVAVEHVRPGGAALAALLVARDRWPVTLITALARDDAGSLLRSLLDRAGVEVIDVGSPDATVEKIRIGAPGHLLMRLDTGPTHSHPGPIDDAAKAALARAGAILVSDYGLGMTAEASVRNAVAAATTSRPVVWDPHPRGAELVPGVTLVTPNASEAGINAGAVLSVVSGAARQLLVRWRAAALVITLGRRGAVLLADPLGTPFVAAARTVSHADACGAGDRFAATATCLLATGARLPDVVTGAVAAATEFVSTGGASSVDQVCPGAGMLGRAVGVGFHAGPAAGGDIAGAPQVRSNGNRPDAGAARADGRTGVPRVTGNGHRLRPVRYGATPQADRARGSATPRAGYSGNRPMPQADPSGAGSAGDAVLAELGARAEQVAAAVREAGGTVVATGGCFDILHAGHVALLQAARSHGDCLIVCLNSDDSVRRLKGPRRPVQPVADRAAVLTALDCVDAVVVFDGDTPEAVLRRLRPDIFAKGEDYSGATLPEAAVIADWGGRAILLPLLEGRSTSKVLKEAVAVARI